MCALNMYNHCYFKILYFVVVTVTPTQTDSPIVKRPIARSNGSDLLSLPPHVAASSARVSALSRSLPPLSPPQPPIHAARAASPQAPSLGRSSTSTAASPLRSIPLQRRRIASPSLQRRSTPPPPPPHPQSSPRILF
uniref:Uncharacterized protein n=1 Tax=Oryza meridionalis TaxID=40149 RepID=A0A0E0EGW1_9ORYZ